MNKVCINNDNCDLTIGKVYDVYHDNHSSEVDICRVEDNVGMVVYVSKTRFISLEEFRNNQINLILQDESSLYK